MPTVQLGHHDGRVTTVAIPESRAEPHLDVTAPDGVWAHHASGGPPAWVSADDPLLESTLAAHYDCPAGRPDEEGL